MIGAPRNWAAGRQDIVIAHAPLEVRSPRTASRNPTRLCFCTASTSKRRDRVDRVPEICVEVLSSDRAYDRISKRFVCGAAGVSEYWVVEPAGFIERWDGPGLARAEIVEGRPTSPLLPGFALELPERFAEIA